MQRCYLCIFQIGVLATVFSPSIALGDLVDPSNLTVITNTLGNFDSRFDIGNATDGSDLVPYAASTEHALVHDDGSWFSANGVTSGFIIIDMGIVRTIDAIYFWNESDGTGSTGQEIPFVFLETSLFSNLGYSYTSAGSGPLNILPGEDVTQDDPMPAAGVFFDAVEARYVRITVPGGNGGNLVGLREIAINAIPEPTSCIFLVAALSITVLRRSRVGRR